MAQRNNRHLLISNIHVSYLFFFFIYKVEEVLILFSSNSALIERSILCNMCSPSTVELITNWIFDYVVQLKGFFQHAKAGDLSND